MKTKTHSKILRALCLFVVLLMLPIAALPISAEDGNESYNFAIGQKIEANNTYVPPEGFFHADFLVDGEWLTYAGDNVKLGWNTDPYSGIGETDPVEIIITLDTYYVLDKIVICPMKWARGEAFPRGYELLGSLDGAEWFELYETQTDLSALADDDNSVAPKEYVLNTPTTIKYFCIRIIHQSRVVDQTGSSTSALGEIELYGYKDTEAASKAEAEAAKALEEAKATAKTDLQAYRADKNDQDYREAQVAELNDILSSALTAIDGATDIATVNSTATAAKKEMDAVKTDAQLTAEETTTEEATEEVTEPIVEETTEEATEEVTEEATTEAVTEADTVEATQPVEETEADTQAATEVDTVAATTAEATDAPAKEGCGAVLWSGAVVMLTAASTAALVLGRKKREE
ncbi:MAG: discoidin domain-containing protein [Clostridia bacterium]|nr:discoidin domain-containing protein [Clostridia bacterium]